MKKVTITINEVLDENGVAQQNLSLESVGVTPIELLGVLRYYEKEIWMNIASGNRPQPKEKKIRK